jgi:hypothetical protein
MPEAEWIKVFETPQLHQAVMAQSILKEHNISAVILNQQDSSYVIMGEISLYVSLENSIEAINILDENNLK